MIAIREARSRGIKILPPDINTSGIGWTVDGDSLRFGLMAIKGVGEKGAAAVIKERAYGEFENLRLHERIPAKAINAKAREGSDRVWCFRLLRRSRWPRISRSLRGRRIVLACR
jgi:DNA polymerase-3 subunit alpha